MDSLGKLLGKLFNRFQSLPSTHRLAGVGVVALIAASLALLVTSGSTTDEREYLFGGQEFSRDEIIAIEKAFGDASLDGWKVVGYRVQIPSANRAQFLAAVSDFQPGIDVTAKEGGLFESVAERSRRAKTAKQQKMAKLVQRMPGIQEAAVEYTEAKSGGFPRTVEKRAAVAVKAIGGRHLDPQEVAAIQSVIFASEAGLPTDNVVVLDITANRTYDGSQHASETPARHVIDKQEELYENRLQQQIRNRLVNYPGVIVEVRAQSAAAKGENAEQAQGDFALRGVAVSIGVPSSYYERLWQKRYGTQASTTGRRPSSLELAEIESETLRKIEEIVSGLLNEIDLPDQRQPNIVVRTDEDFAPLDQVAREDSSWLWTTLSERGQPLLLALLALVIVVAWLVVSRQKQKASGEAAPADEASETPITARKTAGAITDEEFAHGDDPIANESPDDLQDQLSRLVQRDPDAAVDALRKWIRKVA